MDYQIVEQKGERGWEAARDLPQESLLGCEGPWLLKSTDKKDKSFLTPVENADLRLTEDYLLAHQKWKKKESFLEQRLSPFSDVTLDEKTRAIFQEALDTGKTQLVANPETLFSQLRHHPSRMSTKGEMYETLSQLAKRFQFPVQIVAKIHNVMATNAYSPGCFLTSSYVNHSCKHNAIALWDSKSLSFARLNKMGQRALKWRSIVQNVIFKIQKRTDSTLCLSNL